MTKPLSLFGILLLSSCANPITYNNVDYIGFMGGSITYGSVATAPEKRWVNIVASGKTFKNAGIPRYGTWENEPRIYQDLLRYNPDIVFIDAGVNDQAPLDEGTHTATDLPILFESMLQQCIDNGSVPVVIDFAMAWDVEKIIENVNYKTQANIIHESVCKKLGVEYHNIGKMVALYCIEKNISPYDIIPDGYHPNDTGHALYAKFILQKVNL